LEQVPARAGLECVEEVVVVARHGQHYDLCRRRNGKDPTDRRDPAPGHVDVDEAEIGCVLLGCADCGVRVSDPADAEAGLQETEA
jgi:hypothetical protein